MIRTDTGMSNNKHNCTEETNMRIKLMLTKTKKKHKMILE